MDLPTLTEQLDGSEVLTLIKNGRNIQLMVSQFLNFDMFTPEQLESLRGPQGLDGKNAYQTWLAQGNVGTYDDYLTILQLPALTASETLTITVNNKLDEADNVIIKLNNKNEEMQQVISEATIAKDLAQEVVTHPPAIINGYWHLWNHVTNQYDTTYVKAAGDTAYEIWLAEGNTGTKEDFLEWFQSPANEAIASIQEVENIALYNETLRATAEGLRVTAETSRNNAEGDRATAEIGRENAESNRVEAETARSSAETGRQTAEGLRQQAELNRQTNTSTAISNAEQATFNANDAAILANEKAGLANEKALLANEKAGLAATATTQANDARDGANNAAQTANEAATNISPAVINNEQVQAETYNVLNARISALESLIANGIFSYLQADTLIGVNSMLYKGAEFFLYGTAAPNIAPDFIGQFYINTTAGTTYQAKGIANAADWKQISN